MKKIRELLSKKGLKQMDLVRCLGIDPGRVSMFVNEILPLPKKYHKDLSKLLGVSMEEISTLNRRGKI